MQDLLKALLTKHDIRLAILFGSQSSGQVRPDSDIDLAVLGNGPLSVQLKSMLIAEISDTFGRPVDLVDLHTVGEPLLGQIFKGQRIVGSASDYARLLTRHLLDTADFLPLQLRILKERRDTWIR